MADVGVARELGELLQQALALLVGGVGLAGDDELDRPLLVEQQGRSRSGWRRIRVSRL